MKRQAGKIRLERGDAKSGLQHIEERHGAQIRSIGFDGVEAFVYAAISNIESIWRPSKSSQLVAVQANDDGKAVFIELKPSRSGDFYTVNTAFPVGYEYAERKGGWELLWGGSSVPTVASGADSLAGTSPNAGATSAMTPSQSSTPNIAQLSEQRKLDGDKLTTVNQESRDKPLFSKGQLQDVKDLIIQHNLTAENLIHADRMGGIPVPSLAVTKADSSMTSFGEITLIGDKEMANPKGYANTKIFGADIYSPRYPDVTYRLNSNALKNLNAILAPYSKGREIYGSEIKSSKSLTENDAFILYAQSKLGENVKNKYYELKNLAADTLREAGADGKIFQGYTNEGDRKYTPHTLENVVKILKKEMRGGEKFDYGVGTVRSKFTPQFKSVSQIKDAKNKLVSNKEFEKVEKEVNDEFFAISSELDAHHPIGKKSRFFDTVSSMMYDAATMGIPRSLKENGFDEVPAEKQKRIADFLHKLRWMPTEYFEAKILRVVSVSEFRGAVVPQGTEQAVLDILTRNGVKYVTYNRNDEAARRDAVNKLSVEMAEQVRFSKGQTPPQGHTNASMTSRVTKVLESQTKGLSKLVGGMVKVHTSDQIPSRIINGNARRSEGRSGEGERFARMILEEFTAENDAAFIHPVSSSQTLEVVLSEVAKAKYLGEETSEDERDQSGADRKHLFKTVDGIAFHVYETDEGNVWINVGKLETGGSGQAIYAAVANYAFNARKVFVADPAGLTVASTFRRTSNMLSSAMRFGTTRHLGAAPQQIEGNAAHGIEPLDWSGTDIDKIEALIYSFVTTSLRRAPALKDYGYDFRLEKFTGSSGQPITGAAMAGNVGGAALIGASTARRVVFLKSLISEGRKDESSGRSGILENVLRWGDVRSPENLKALFSRDDSKSGTIRAYVDPKDGTVHLISDNIPADWTDKQILGLLTHEISVHVLKLGKNDKEFKAILNQAEVMRKNGNVKMQEAFDRVPKDTAPEDVTHEMLAYFTEQNPTNSLAQRFFAWFRAQLRKLGFNLELSEGDIIAMASDALKRAVDVVPEARGGVAMASKAPSEPSRPQQSIRARKGFNIDPETKIERIQRSQQDGMNRWAKVQRQIKEQGGTLELDQDVYHAMERMGSRAGNRIDKFTHETVKPLLKRMADIKTNLEEVGTYLLALGAKDRNAYIQTIRADMPDNGSGMRDIDAATIIADYKKRPDFAAFDALARDIQKLTERKLSVLVQGGVMTEGQAADLGRDFGFYVPYKGFETIDEEGNRTGGAGAGYSTPSRFSKHAFGRISQAGQAVENIIRDYEMAIILAEKTNVGRYVRNLAEANPDPTLWTVDVPPKKPSLVNGHVKMMQATFDNENEVRFIEGGKEVRIQLNDKLLARAYNNIGQEKLNMVLTLANDVNNVLRQTYTQKNPAFILVNGLRDILTGLTVGTAEMGAVAAVKMLRHTSGAWRAAYRESMKRGSSTGAWKKYIDAYRDNGAMMAFYSTDVVEAKQEKLEELMSRVGGQTFLDMYRRRGAGKALGLAAHRAYNNGLIDVVESLNGGFENMMRLSAFRQYVDDNGGLSSATPKVLAEASRIAKNLTVNFNRKGEATRSLNSLYLFWNASVQGTQNIYRAAMSSKHKHQVRAIMGTLFGLGMMTALMTDDEDEDLLPEHVKSTSATIKLWDNAYLALPLAYGLGFFFVTGRAVGNLIKGRHTVMHTAIQIADATLTHFSPLGSPIHDGNSDVKSVLVSAAPTIVKPLAMSAVNRNSFGSDLVPKFNEDMPDRDAMSKNTRDGVFDKTAGGLEYIGADVSPETLKMMTQYITGGLGTFLAGSADALMAGGKGEFDAEKTPIIKRFYGELDIEEHRSRFYELANDVKSQATAQQRKQKEFFGKNKARDSVVDYTKQMKRLREEESDAYRNAKTASVKRIQASQIALSNDFKKEHERMIKRGLIEK